MASVDSDTDWVVLDSDNPADSSDDDAGVRSVSSGCPTPDCRSDNDDDGGDHLLGAVLALSSATARRARSGTSSDSDEEKVLAATDDPEGLYEPAEAEEVRQPPPPLPKSLSGLFHHTLVGGVNYAVFDPVLLWPEKELIPDPTFSSISEEVSVLASSRGLVCLRGRTSGAYFVANPATNDRVRLPRHNCDHLAYGYGGEPAVVIAFEDTYTCCADHRGHYHVVVAFPLGDGVCGYESFSSRTWEWTVAEGVSAVEQVVAASGVGALGCAFWRTTMGYFLCYNPAARNADLFPAPQEVLQWPYWELGEMNGTLSVTCMDALVNEVVVLNLKLEHAGAGDITWTLAGHFEGGCLRNRDQVQLLRSQGPEVVMWDPMVERVVATDIEGRTTRTIGPLSGHQYIADFIPYVSSSTGITRIEAGAKCKVTAAVAEAQ
ncbi:hypothetical protein EJB05_00106 [Eragrostis curvula]|uniref:F-box associated domain-containing protein n=1 Tax=Eragrostis curvula TaxID=38414 RepID=A0A5J9WLR6_9POAL|nr:hypothetical protein EJB05_00106 [Eragrostis curvula]